MENMSHLEISKYVWPEKLLTNTQMQKTKSIYDMGLTAVWQFGIHPC